MSELAKPEANGIEATDERSHAPKEPVVEATGAVSVRVTTRFSRHALWLGVVATTLAAATGNVWVSVAVSIASMLAANYTRLLGFRMFCSVFPEDVAEVGLGESDPSGVTLELLTHRGMQVRFKVRGLRSVQRILDSSSLADRRLSIVGERDLARVIVVAAYSVVVIVVVGFATYAGGLSIDAASLTWLLGIVSLLVGIPFVRMLLPWERLLVVGADGVRVGSRFVPAATIEGAELHSRWELAIHTREGPRVAPIGVSTDERAAWLLDRVRSIARGESLNPSTLGRAGRSLAHWRRDLEARVRGDYREPALIPERLVETLFDSAAVPDRRLGASIALWCVTPEGQRGALQARLREVAAASADAALAKAFEELASGALTPATAEGVRSA